MLPSGRRSRFIVRRSDLSYLEIHGATWPQPAFPLGLVCFLRLIEYFKTGRMRHIRYSIGRWACRITVAYLYLYYKTFCDTLASHRCLGTGCCWYNHLGFTAAGVMNRIRKEGFVDTLRTLLMRLAGGVRWKAWRLQLELPPEPVSVPTLRGVWGAALHDLDPAVYARVFEGQREGCMQRPLYVLRSAPDHAALDCIHIGAALDHETVLMRAWDIAGGRGLGKQRIPFLLRQQTLLADSSQVPRSASWPEHRPCRMAFLTPLRLLHQGMLITSPTLQDVALAALRRLWDLQEQQPDLPRHEAIALVVACCEDIPVLYEPVERRRVTRYSARQEQDLELRCVIGAMLLPEGPGALAPLLNAALWLHVGKGATLGMGQMELQPLKKTQ